VRTLVAFVAGRIRVVAEMIELQALRNRADPALVQPAVRLDVLTRLALTGPVAEIAIPVGGEVAEDQTRRDDGAVVICAVGDRYSLKEAFFCGLTCEIYDPVMLIANLQMA
jgi:hypothetical protein